MKNTDSKRLYLSASEKLSNDSRRFNRMDLCAVLESNRRTKFALKAVSNQAAT